MKKKGISPLIATVLIIGFTIVLAALVITWGTKLFQSSIESTKTSSEISLICSSISLEGSATATKSGGSINFNSVNIEIKNKNQLGIKGLHFVFPKEDGTTYESFSGSTDSNTIKANCIPDAPVSTNFGLNAFETETYTFYPTTGTSGDAGLGCTSGNRNRSEEHTSELQS